MNWWNWFNPWYWIHFDENREKLAREREAQSIEARIREQNRVMDLAESRLGVSKPVSSRGVVLASSPKNNATKRNFSQETVSKTSKATKDDDCEACNLNLGAAMLAWNVGASSPSPEPFSGGGGDFGGGGAGGDFSSSSDSSSSSSDSSSSFSSGDSGSW